MRKYLFVLVIALIIGSVANHGTNDQGVECCE